MIFREADGNDSEGDISWRVTANRKDELVREWGLKGFAMSFNGFINY
jgi:hypothetical protein